MVGIYYLCCTYFTMSIKSIFQNIPLFENEWLMMLIIIYWVVFTAIMEEWYWRNFVWGVMYNDRTLEKVYLAATWGLMYSAIVF